MPFFTRQGRHLFLRLPSAAASHPIHPCSAVVVRREVPAEKEEGKKGRISRPYLTLLSCGFCPSGPSFIGGTEPGRPSLPPLILRKRSPPLLFSTSIQKGKPRLKKKVSYFRPLFSSPSPSLFGGNGTRKRVMVFSSSSSSFLAKGKSTAFSYPHTLTHEEEGKRRDFTDGRGRRRRRRRRREGLSAFYDWPVQRRGRVSHFSDFASLLPLSCPGEGGRKGNSTAARPPARPL